MSQHWSTLSTLFLLASRFYKLSPTLIQHLTIKNKRSCFAQPNLNMIFKMLARVSGCCLLAGALFYVAYNISAFFFQLLQHHYLKEDPLCKASSLRKDPESKKQYLDLIQIWMQDKTSLIAVSKNSGRVVGTIITRINSLHDKTNTYSRVHIYEGKALESVMNFKSALVTKADVYSKFKIEKYLRIYILCVHPSYEKRNLSAELLYASYQLTISLGIAAVGGIFTCAKNQDSASHVGFKMLTEIKYCDWVVDEKHVFINPEMGNYSAAFMGNLTSDEKILEEIFKFRKRTWETENERKICRSKIM